MGLQSGAVKKRLNGERVQIAAALALLAVLAAPMLVLCFYAGPSADDFSHLLEPNRWRGLGMGTLAAAFAYAKSMFLTWQGTYFSMFINALNPLMFWGAGAVPATCVCVLLFFWAAALAAVRTALACVLRCRAWSVTLWVYLAVLFLGTQFTNPSEWFYWYSGAASYTIPAGLLLLGGAAACRAALSRGKRRAALAAAGAVCLVCACGGTLMVAAFGCYAFVGAALGMCLLKKRGAPLTAAFAGLCVACTAANAFAPGNFIRQSAAQGQAVLPLYRALVYTLMRTLDAVTQSFPLLVAAGVLLLLGGLAAGAAAQSGFSFAWPGLVLPGAWAGLYVAAFPYIYGMGVPFYQAHRVESALVWFTCLVCVFSLFYLAGWLSRRGRRKDFPRGGACAVTAVAVVALAAGFAATSPNEVLCMDIAGHFATGEIQQQKAYTDMALAALAAPGKETVALPAQGVYYNNVKSLELQPGAGHWVNRAMATWYGKAAVLVE